MADHEAVKRSDGSHDALANPVVERGRLELTQSQDGIPTLTVSGGNAIAKGIRVVDESGKVVAAYVGFCVDDLSVAKSMHSAVSGAIAHSLDGISEKQAAKVEAPSGVIVGHVGPDTPVKLSPDEFREQVVITLTRELIDLSRDLRR
ncbi:hypothetical protein [Streptomyces griseocarneus]|uniref:hypothetical protein n=1 Tax=Streptomyces griseocarneus TaxID=51201 RepID=UPI00167E156A|nr:hypothetical protein [Streptomyces griseocarneus]MBZ6474092.1 hypothetical protein [Streptomyces griseocarneus]GHG52057.1 hypothetical protein GCM10018779_12800 [Streptomyces griseocarneus]